MPFSLPSPSSLLKLPYKDTEGAKESVRIKRVELRENVRVKKAVIYISIRVGRKQGFDILVLKLISAYIKSILLNNACNACVATEDQAFI